MLRNKYNENIYKFSYENDTTERELKQEIQNA